MPSQGEEMGDVAVDDLGAVEVQGAKGGGESG